MSFRVYPKDDLHGGRNPRLARRSFRPDKTADPRRTRRDARFSAVSDANVNHSSNSLRPRKRNPNLPFAPFKFKRRLLFPCDQSDGFYRQRRVEIEHKFINRLHNQRLRRQNAFYRLLLRINAQIQIISLYIVSCLLRNQHTAGFRRANAQFSLRENRDGKPQNKNQNLRK